MDGHTYTGVNGPLLYASSLTAMDAAASVIISDKNVTEKPDNRKPAYATSPNYCFCIK